MIQIIGNTVSPYVRKVLAVLAFKEIPFEIDPIVPFFGNDEFSKLSPLRRIPVLIDGDVVVNDSSAIVQYLEEIAPEPSILPETPVKRAQARWLEEFADSRMGDVFVWKGFGRVVIAPVFFGTVRDLDAFSALCETEVAEIMDYLEGLAPEDGFLLGEFGLADISVAVMFRNMMYARWTPDAARWPKAVRWLARAEAHPALAGPTAWSDALARTPPAEQRDKLASLGLKLTENSYLSAAPRRGPMTQIG